MSPELSFASEAIATTVAGAAASLLAGAAMAALIVPQVSRRILPQPRETHLSDYLPFSDIDPDGKTVLCRGGTICQFIGIAGIDQTFVHAGEAMMLAQARKNMIDALAESGVTMRIFTIRDPIKLDPGTGYPNKYAAEVARRWNRSFEKAFSTRTVICLSMRDGRDPSKLDEAVGVVESILQQYRPSQLTQNPLTSPWKDMTLGQVLGRLTAPLSRPSPRGFGDNLAAVLAGDEVTFLKNGRIRFGTEGEAKYCSVMGLRRLGDDLNTLISNELAALPCEMVILQHVQPQPKAETLLKLKQQQRMIGSTSFSADVLAQYQEAIQMVEGLDETKACLCHFSEVIFLYADTEKELDVAEKMCRSVLNAHGITAVREKGATQASWFLQFPTYDIKPRLYRLMSTNVAMLSTFERPPTGLPKSDWGPGPIALFYTGANTVYSHQFHVSTEPAAVGHGLCIAPTGAGKTVLMQFLSCMASRQKNLRHFFFDRYQGTYPYTTIMGGKYLGFNADKFTLSVKGGMNPMACDETDENIEFLKVWIQAISGCTDYESIDQISQAIEIAFATLDKDERSLASIYEGAFTPGTELRKELQKWVDPTQYGAMFNAEQDCIDLDGNWLTTFDMTNLLNDKLLGGASVSYIMHKIRQTLRRNRAPGFIFIDETEPLLRDPNFKNIYLVMLQEFRKLSGVIISVFQRPEALRASGISELVRQQCSTYYLFQNPGATEKDYAEFELTDREVGFLLGHTQTARRTSRGILVKRPATKESVVLDIDLSNLGPYLRVFSSNSKDVGLASDLQRQFGTAWVEKYVDYEAP